MGKHGIFCKVREGWRWSPLEYLARFPGTPAFVNVSNKDRSHDIKTAIDYITYLASVIGSRFYLEIKIPNTIAIWT